MALNISAERGAIQAQQDDTAEHWPSLPTPLGIERPSLSSTVSSLPSPQPVPKTPERLSAAAIPLEFLENVQRVEISETRVRDGETYFVLDVFLHHFDTRLPANLNYLRRAVLMSSSPAAATVDGSSKPDYQVERRFIDFCDLRHQVYEAACMNPGTKCQSCDDFIVYVRFKLRQPRPIMHLVTTGRQVARMKILAAFVNEFLHMTLCKERQNHKCQSHACIPQYLEAFVRDHSQDTEASSLRLSWI